MASSQIHLLISSFKAYLWIAGYSSLQLEPKEPSLVRRWNLDSFNFDLWPGSRWVGWMNESQQSDSLEITFQFDNLRKFSAMALHTSHIVTRDVQGQRRAKKKILYLSEIKNNKLSGKPLQNKSKKVSRYSLTVYQ
uniref:Discoidin domain-containing protein n=1 Tax=Rhodnius prolixus TaxID=13249 RepID=T1I6J8_RHOPR